MPYLASQSSSTAASLPPLSQLQTWVHRPQAIAKCSVSDIYALQALLPGNGGSSYREIFLLNQYPCKMVELVGWVAGVEDREAFMNITLDDGDGSAVLQVKYWLPRIAPSQPTQPTQPSPNKARSNFRSKAERQLAEEAAAKAELERTFRRAEVKRFERKDIRVGDVVRIVGKVDEYSRHKVTGQEWVRGVTVEEGAGGRIVVVDPDQQYLHVAEVMALHESTYCRPFSIPLLPAPTQRPTFSQTMSEPDKSFSQLSDGFEGQSEMMSELSIGDGGALPDIRKLRSSQLHDNTFRRYLLDHMTEEVRIAALNADIAGPTEVDRALHKLFPEYKLNKGKARAVLTSAPSPNIGVEPFSTPRNFRSKAERMALVQPQNPYPVFTISSLVATPHLAELADMIIDSEAKKAERRRRRRIRDGEATAKDLKVEEAASQSAKGKVEWRITGEKKQRAMERLVSWGLRSISEEGSLVHVQPESAAYDNFRTPTAAKPSVSLDTTSYITLPPPLILPLLVRQLEIEKDTRSRNFVSRSDPRWGNGMTLPELLYKMRIWGEEGRWERLGEWRVEEGLQWGLIRGVIMREGQGYWAMDRGSRVG